MGRGPRRGRSQSRVVVWLLLKTLETGPPCGPESRGGAGEIEPAIVKKSFLERWDELTRQLAGGGVEAGPGEVRT